MKFNVLSAAKLVATGIVGLGTSKIVGGIIKNNVAAPETLIDKVTILAAGWVISGMASSATKTYTDELIDGAVKAVSEVVDGIKTTKKLARIQNKTSTWEEEGLNPEDFVQDPITKVWSKIPDDDIDPKKDSDNWIRVADDEPDGK